MLKVIGGVPDGEYKAVASGTLPNGKPVVVNADGAVSVVNESSFAESMGAETQFPSSANNTAYFLGGTYDSGSDRVVITFRDTSNAQRGAAIVGEVSGNSVTWGTATAFESGRVQWTSCAYDSVNDKVVIAYQDQDNSFYGTAVVGTVNPSDNSITFGTPVVFESAESTYIDTAYDASAGAIVVNWANNVGSGGRVIAGTVSGTSITFGSVYTFDGSTGQYGRSVYHPEEQCTIIAWRSGSAGYGRAITVSGTTITMGSTTAYQTGGQVNQNDIAYDADSKKIVIIARDEANATYGSSWVGTVSGTTLTFASPVTFQSGSVDWMGIEGWYTGGVAMTYDNQSGTSRITFKFGTISGTTITWGTGTDLYTGTGNSGYTGWGMDTNNGKLVMVYNANSVPKYRVYNPDYSSTNLTAENYIGMSKGVVNSVDAVVGTESVFDTTTFGILDSVSVYDPDTQKTIIAYADRDNGDAVTAVVATVTGTTFSFGTPVVAHAGSDTEQIGIAYDTTNDRVVITYKNVDNSNYGTAVVGQVSGTSITFGTPVVYEAAASSYNAIDFDANSGKVVIAYMDGGNSNYGTAIVGTVSGTSISFGTPVVFNSGVSQYMSTVYDPSSQNTVIAYRDSSVLNRGEAIVGTVSGTSISFGSVTLFDSTSGHEADNISAAYDPDTQQVIVAYREGNISGLKTHGRAVVGSVSGTSITFGDPTSFNAVSTQYIAAGYDTVANKVVIAYRDRDNSDYGTVVAGSISGTSLSFETPVVYSGTDAVIYIGASYNEAAGSFVISYRDMTSLDGTAVAYQASYIQRYPVADGDNALLDIIGSVSDNQLSLTAGEKYYVQTDGTLSTTAGSPSVLAGTAISATKLVVKT